MQTQNPSTAVLLDANLQGAITEVIKSIKTDIEYGAFSVYTTDTDNFGSNAMKEKRKCFMKEGFDFKNEFAGRLDGALKGMTPDDQTRKDQIENLAMGPLKNTIEGLNRALRDDPELKSKEAMKYEQKGWWHR